MNTHHKADESFKYMGWEVFGELPTGFKKDAKTGSPLAGYDFFTNGKSVLNGQIRILVKNNSCPASKKTSEIIGIIDELKAKKKHSIDPMERKDIREKVNTLARRKFMAKLLEEIEFDLMVCKLEGWSMESYVYELKLLIDDIFQKMIKSKI